VFSLDLVTEKVELSHLNEEDEMKWNGIGSEKGRYWCEEIVVFVNRRKI
jgi:GH35 family endo-1,4-beta-xylanase